MSKDMSDDKAYIKELEKMLDHNTKLLGVAVTDLHNADRRNGELQVKLNEIQKEIHRLNCELVKSESSLGALQRINREPQDLKDKLAEDEQNTTWSETPPNEEGIYWFYGEVSYGSMGGHYTGTILPEQKLHCVTIWKISNGFMAVTDGHFMSLQKFDASKRQEGHIGVWQKVVLPKLPVKAIG